MGVVAELCDHPGAEDRSQPGRGADDLSGRVLLKMRLDLLVLGRDLLVQGDKDGDQRPCGGGVCGGDGSRLAQVPFAQGGLDRRGLGGQIAATPGTPQRRADLADGRPAQLLPAARQPVRCQNVDTTTELGVRTAIRPLCGTR
ncbi:hypothetical protein ACWEPL_60445 [Nonomuraea sp. NPDC004186]